MEVMEVGENSHHARAADGFFQQGLHHLQNQFHRLSPGPSKQYNPPQASNVAEGPSGGSRGAQVEQAVGMFQCRRHLVGPEGPWYALKFSAQLITEQL
jgi:hypothetical protein